MIPSTGSLFEADWSCPTCEGALWHDEAAGLFRCDACERSSREHALQFAHECVEDHY